MLRNDRGLPPSRLVAAGYLGADHRSYLDGIQRSLTAAGLGDEFQYFGTVDREQKVQFLQSIDVLSVPSGYHEPKGLYLLEAMASGVPVVQPNHGAFPELIDRTGGGLLASSERPWDIADGILELWRDPARAAAMGARGAAGVRRAYTIDQMATAMLAVYSELTSSRRAPQAATA